MPPLNKKKNLRPKGLTANDTLRDMNYIQKRDAAGGKKSDMSTGAKSYAEAQDKIHKKASAYGIDSGVDGLGNRKGPGDPKLKTGSSVDRSAAAKKGWATRKRGGMTGKR